MTAPLLEVEHLSVSYDTTTILWDLQFTLPAGGKSIGILGPNGAGKSTLLKAVLGLVRPLAGTVSFFGQSLDAVRSRVAYVPQRASIDWDFPISAEDLVLMGRYRKLGLLKWARKADRRAAREALAMVGMEGFAHKSIGQLSGGQQQRLFIARALLQEADLYLMDEPFAGIDHTTEQAIVQIFESLKQQGKSLLIVHHDLSTVAEYFDWTILLNTCLIACGPTSTVFSKENISRTYGRGSLLLNEALLLSQEKTKGRVR